MRNRPVTASRWKSIVSAAALACLASAAFVQTIEPAEARRMNRCQVKHSMCTERCLMKNADGGACIARTCDRQYRGCGSESHEPGMSGVEEKPSGGKGPRRAGRLLPEESILTSGGSVFSPQGPSAIGTPASAPKAPAAPPVIIR